MEHIYCSWFRHLWRRHARNYDLFEWLSCLAISLLTKLNRFSQLRSRSPTLPSPLPSRCRRRWGGVGATAWYPARCIQRVLRRWFAGRCQGTLRPNGCACVPFFRHTPLDHHARARSRTTCSAIQKTSWPLKRILFLLMNLSSARQQVYRMSDFDWSLLI